MSTVLVTGAGGYIGIPLIEQLLADGHKVIGLDRYYFGKDLLGTEILNNQNFELRQKDIRNVTEEDFKGVDVVMDLAGLSNDPSCDLKPKLTYDINFKGGMNMADYAKAAGVDRYIFSSSCSAYGLGESNQLTEESGLHPQSYYAHGKVDVENHIREIGKDGSFCYTMMRNATVYGLSKRMRFDLVINVMTMKAWIDGKIYVLGGGKQWRPLVHVKDVVQAFLKVMSAPKDKVCGQVYNVGSSEQNFQVFQIAKMVKTVLPQTEVILVPDDPDKRTYNVSFEKIKNELDFKPNFTPEDGIREIAQALTYGVLDPDDPRTRTIDHYRFLLKVEDTMAELAKSGRIF